MKGIEAKSREPVEFEAFEASSREDVVKRLYSVGVRVVSIDGERVPGAPEVDEPEPAPMPQAEVDEQPTPAVIVPPVVHARKRRRPWRLNPFTTMLAVAGGVLLADFVGLNIRAAMIGVSQSLKHWQTAKAAAATAATAAPTKSPEPPGVVSFIGTRLADNVVVESLTTQFAWAGDDGEVHMVTVAISNRSDSVYSGVVRLVSVDGGGQWLRAGPGAPVIVAPGKRAVETSLVMVHRDEAANVKTFRTQIETTR